MVTQARASCTCSASVFIPRRMSVTPSPGRRERRPEPGASTAQGRKNPPQRRAALLAVDNHPKTVRQRDVHPARRRHGAGAGIGRRRRQAIRLDNNRHETAPLAILTTPGEQQVGVHVIAPRHQRNRNPGLVALCNDPPLLSLAPAAARRSRPRWPCIQPLQCFRHPRSCPLPIAQPRPSTLIRKAAPAEGCYQLARSHLGMLQPARQPRGCLQVALGRRPMSRLPDRIVPSVSRVARMKPVW